MVEYRPSHTTDALWWFWLEFKRMYPSAQLGGTYAGKPGYHNTVWGNDPRDYSVQLREDTHYGPKDMSRAIDITFPDAQRGNYATIAKYSKRLYDSGRDVHDPRGNYLREFYGNIDWDRYVEGWDFQFVGPASSDASHLWHIHLSFLTRWITSKKAMRAVLSILRGESVAVWRLKELGKASLPTAPKPSAPTSIRDQAPVGYGVVHPSVLVLQRAINVIFKTAIAVDGRFGERTLFYVHKIQTLGGFPEGNVVTRELWDYISRRYHNERKK